MLQGPSNPRSPTLCLPEVIQGWCLCEVLQSCHGAPLVLWLRALLDLCVLVPFVHCTDVETEASFSSTLDWSAQPSATPCP